MRVMVTGGNGFMGRHLVRQLRSDGVAVSALVRTDAAAEAMLALGATPVLGDITDPQALRLALREPTDCVFHAAADTSPWRGHAERQTRTNVEGTRNVLEQARAAGVRRFVHTSSVSAFGQQSGVISETSPRLGAQSWINYERSKALAEDLVNQAGNAGVIETVILNPVHILGPGDTRNWARLFLLLDQNKLPGAPPGSGPFADVREVARAHMSAWRHAPNGASYVLGGAQSSFLHLIQLIAAELGRQPPQRAMPAALLRSYAWLLDMASRVTGREPSLTPQAASFTCHHLEVDCSKAMRELEYRITPLPQLVADTAAWLRSEGLLRSG